jgi:hypothetical protein
MKSVQLRSFFFLVFVLASMCSLTSCSKSDIIYQQPNEDNNESSKNVKIKISIKDKEFLATLNDSEAAQEFEKLLPLEVVMQEHNGNEKYYNLSKTIAGRATKPDKVKAGDLKIWSGSTLVLFYAEASTYYSYINLGRIEDISGLEELIGKESVKVKFEIDKE